MAIPVTATAPTPRAMTAGEIDEGADGATTTGTAALLVAVGLPVDGSFVAVGVELLLPPLNRLETALVACDHQSVPEPLLVLVSVGVLVSVEVPVVSVGVEPSEEELEPSEEELSWPKRRIRRATTRGGKRRPNTTTIVMRPSYERSACGGFSSARASSPRRRPLWAS
jgi:hypothetical protein